MSILMNTPEMLQAGHATAIAAAKKAAQDYLDEHLGGEDNYPCGFARVVYYPQSKGNTIDGRNERRLIESIGFEKDVYGKSYELSNPSGSYCQNVDVKYAGAKEYAKILGAVTGIKVYATERLD